MSDHVPKHSFAIRFATALLGTGLAAGLANAQNADFSGTLANPPVAKLQPLDRFESPIPDNAIGSLAAPAPGVDAYDLLAYEFDVNMTEFQIRNPRNPPNRPFDTVRLRSYFGAAVAPTQPIVGPTVKLNPGERFRLTIDNNLPVKDPTCVNVTDPNTPHCFNSTNMHTHGFWVSPAGNSDNVLIHVKPEVEFIYEYNLPVRHPAGTFWYHPHLHGSTALQVGSGMAGAMIVEAERLPTEGEPGDVDILLQRADGTKYPDQIVLLQQIPYACRDANGAIKTDADGIWICDEGDVGEVASYDQFGGGSKWQKSGRYVSINGRVLPNLAGERDNPFRSGEVSRWRMISGGLRESMRPTFYKANADNLDEIVARGYDAITDQEHADFISANCDPSSPVPQFSIATDGLTREKVVRQDATLLHPGYRDDLLMVFPEPGIYCLVDGELDAKQTVSDDAKGTELLAYVIVQQGQTTGIAPENVIRATFERSARRAFGGQGPIFDSVVADIRNGLRLDHFVWHESMMNITGLPQQTAGFTFIGDDFLPGVGKVDEDWNVVDPQQFKSGRIDHKLILGSADEWRLTSSIGGHPFHIHVNPFQVVSIVAPDGSDVSSHDPANGSPFKGLQGAWKDTLFVPQDHRITVRTRYERYIGDFVLHCHILDHEDQGMMQNVSIILPGTESVMDHQ